MASRNDRTEEQGLAGRTAVVTGGGRGIGRAIALELARAGARVIVVGRGAGALAETCAAIRGAKGQAVALAADVTAKDIARRLDEAAGAVDVLVNNAAVFAPYAPLEEVDEQAIARVFETDLMAPLGLCRHVLPGMKQRGFGRIVNIGTIAAGTGAEGQVAYATAKAGLVGLTRSVAAEGARHGVTCNLVEPGLIATERIAEAVAEPYQRRILANVAAGRSGTPEEVAALVAFLCSPRAAYVNGAVIPVSGGFGVGLYARQAPPARKTKPQR